MRASQIVLVVCALLALWSVAKLFAASGRLPAIVIHTMAAEKASPPPVRIYRGAGAKGDATKKRKPQMPLLAKLMDANKAHGPSGITTDSRPEEIAAPGALTKRLLLMKEGGGHFVQHVMSAATWIESSPSGAGLTFVWKAVKRDGGAIILKDISMPRRKDLHCRLQFDLQKAGPPKEKSKTVVVGSFSFGRSATGPWSERRNVLCTKGFACKVKAARKYHLPRVIYKYRGGSFMELESGAAWGETNTDEQTASKKPLFYFGTVKESKKELLLLDAGRDLWIRIRPGPSPRGEPPLTAAEMARSSIALATGSQQEEQLKNNQDIGSPWSVLSHECDPTASCLAVRQEHDRELKEQGAGPPLHHIFSLDGSKKYHWLAMVYRYWFLKTQRPESTFTRLLSADKLDDLPINTFLAKPPKELFAKDHYVPYNKITAISQWIKSKHDELPKDQIVCIIDVDVVLLEDLSYLAVNVGRGAPLGAKGFMSFMGPGSDTPYDRVIKRYAPGGVEIAAPLAVPYFIHKTDLLHLVDKWLLKTLEIRADTQPWSKVTDWRAHKPLQLAWTGEQWAFLCAAAEAGLQFDVREDASAFAGCGTLELVEPMIHFSDWTRGIKDGKVFKWNKQLDGHYALWSIPDVNPANKCEIDKVLLTNLKEARDQIYPHGKQTISKPFAGPYSFQKAGGQR